ncbi:hypothetical protein PUN28_004865 [Cardiocondyla obscurior]|uniref:Uncharacterized protein n=1 Tax=Cardiocondyla obscurior TaxID=286306 RepID=A0AAW2GEQ5_9HYME
MEKCVPANFTRSRQARMLAAVPARRREEGTRWRKKRTEDRRKPGTSRFCYDQWQTGTQRAPFVSIQGRLLRWTLRGVPLSPGSPHPSSARRILRLPRFSDPGGRAVFSFCSCDLSLSPSSAPPFRLPSIASLSFALRLERDTYPSRLFYVLNLI